MRRVFPGEQAHAHLVVDHGVVVGERAQVAATEEVAARVAHVGDDRGVEAQGAEDEGAGHVGAAGKDGAAGINIARVGTAVGRVALVEYGLVGVLHEAGKQRDVHDAFGYFAEACEHGFNGKPRGDFALLLAANAVREREEPALRLDLRGRGGYDVADEVLVVIAGQARVGEFGEFQL